MMVKDRSGQFNRCFLSPSNAVGVIELEYLRSLIDKTGTESETVNERSVGVDIRDSVEMQSYHRVPVSILADLNILHVADRYGGMERIAMYHHPVVQILRRQRRELAVIHGDDILRELTPSRRIGVEIFGASRHAEIEHRAALCKKDIRECGFRYSRRNEMRTGDLGGVFIRRTVYKRIIHIYNRLRDGVRIYFTAYRPRLHSEQRPGPTGGRVIQNKIRDCFVLIVYYGVEIAGEIRIERIDKERGNAKIIFA